MCNDHKGHIGCRAITFADEMREREAGASFVERQRQQRGMLGVVRRISASYKQRKRRTYKVHRDLIAERNCRIHGNFHFSQPSEDVLIGFAPWCHFCSLDVKTSAMSAFYIPGCNDPILGHFMTVAEMIFHLGYAERYLGRWARWVGEVRMYRQVLEGCFSAVLTPIED